MVLKSKSKTKLTEKKFRKVKNISIVSTTGILKEGLIQDIYEYYQDLGCNIHIGKSCFTPRKLTISDDKLRANELMKELNNPKVHAVIFARGGEYSDRILPYLNPDIIKNSDKLIIGFSDLSSILSYFVEHHCSRVYHGPMATDIISSPTKTTRILKSILAGNTPNIKLPRISILNDGEAEGILKGGCISVLSKLIETEYSPSFNNTILFIEDINESQRALRRIFSQFRSARKLLKIKGIIFGEMVNCGRSNKKFWLDFKLAIFEFFFRYQIPIAYNILSGHGKNELYLPFGRKIHLCVKSKKSYIEVLD